jgi:DNA-binding LacI/PurR family transcriptional regulator
VHTHRKRQQAMTDTVTIKNVAEVASVSVVTVSRVFNNSAKVSEETRQRVLKAAAEIGYLGSKGYVSSMRQQLRTGVASEALKEIGFFFHVDGDALTGGPFWSHIMFGVESEARKANINVLCRSISDIVQAPNVFLDAVQQMGINAILLVGPPEVETVHILQHTGLPVVLIDTDVPDLAVDAVLSDYFGGAREAVSYLIRTGHRQIAFISSPVIDKIYTLELRLMGYHAALLNAGLPFNEALYAVSSSPVGHIHQSLSPEGGYEACQRLLARNVPFTAIFCANDLMAIGAIKALREAGLRVPEDISVIGVDDIELAEHIQPTLTTVRVNKEGMGSTAVKTLIARAANPEAEPTTTLLKVELIKRQSVTSPIP